MNSFSTFCSNKLTGESERILGLKWTLENTDSIFINFKYKVLFFLKRGHFYFPLDNSAKCTRLINDRSCIPKALLPTLHVCEQLKAATFKLSLIFYLEVSAHVNFQCMTRSSQSLAGWASGGVTPDSAVLLKLCGEGLANILCCLLSIQCRLVFHKIQHS